MVTRGISNMNGRDYFSPQALKSAENQSSKSRETLIHMHPRDFLSVAKQINVPSKEKLSDIEGAIESGQKLTDIPYLYFVHDAQGNAHVTGHEGRHRAMALLKRGVTSMPVSFRSTTSETKPGEAIRWGSQHKGSYDRIEGEWPKHLHGQDNSNKIPFPVQELRESLRTFSEFLLFIEETLNKPVRTSGGPKKFAVKVRNPETGNIKTVRFGDPNLEIKRDNPKRRKSFRARHKCDTANDKTTARYWSCRQWRSGSKVEA